MDKPPVTQAVRELRANKVDFTAPVYMEKSILDLPRIYINGGKRGHLVGIDSRDVMRVLKPTLVQVGIEQP